MWQALVHYPTLSTRDQCARNVPDRDIAVNATRPASAQGTGISQNPHKRRGDRPCGKRREGGVQEVLME